MTNEPDETTEKTFDVPTVRALINGWLVQGHIDGGLALTTADGHECPVVPGDYGSVAFMDKYSNDDRPGTFELVTDETGKTAGAVSHHGSNAMLMHMGPAPHCSLGRFPMRRTSQVTDPNEATLGKYWLTPVSKPLFDHAKTNVTLARPEGHRAVM